MCKIIDINTLDIALGGWWSSMGNLVIPHYPWKHHTNTIPNCLAITADGSIMLKFNVRGNLLYPRDWIINYYTHLDKASNSFGTKAWMSWLCLSFNRPILFDELVSRIKSAREYHVIGY